MVTLCIRQLRRSTHRHQRALSWARWSICARGSCFYKVVHTYHVHREDADRGYGVCGSVREAVYKMRPGGRSTVLPADQCRLSVFAKDYLYMPTVDLPISRYTYEDGFCRLRLRVGGLGLEVFAWNRFVKMTHMMALVDDVAPD